MRLLLLATEFARELALLRLELLACGHLLHAQAVEVALLLLRGIKGILPPLRAALEFLQARRTLCRALCELLFLLLELCERLLAALLLLAVERHLLGAALPFLFEHRALQGFFLHALAERRRVLLDVLEV